MSLSRRRGGETEATGEGDVNGELGDEGSPELSDATAASGASGCRPALLQSGPSMSSRTALLFSNQVVFELLSSLIGIAEIDRRCRHREVFKHPFRGILKTVYVTLRKSHHIALPKG